MDWTARIRPALHVPGRPDDEGVIEELAQHARALYEQARADGCTPGEADARVAAQIDRWRTEASALRHPSRHTPPPVPPASTSSGAAGVLQDVRYAWRLLRRDSRETHGEETLDERSTRTWCQDPRGKAQKRASICVRRPSCYQF